MKDFNLTMEPIRSVDMTPDNDLPIRILQAYLDNCNVKVATDSAGNCDNPMYQMMNEHQEKRTKILDMAIRILKNDYSYYTLFSG
jgi:hypothetical protein